MGKLLGDTPAFDMIENYRGTLNWNSENLDFYVKTLGRTEEGTMQVWTYRSLEVEEDKKGEAENPQDVYIGATLRSDYGQWNFQVKWGKWTGSTEKPRSQSKIGRSGSRRPTWGK